MSFVAISVASSPLAWFSPEKEKSPQTKSWAKTASDSLDTFTRLTSAADGFQYMSRLLACVADVLSPCVPLPAFKQTFSAVDNFVASVRIIYDAKVAIGQNLLDRMRSQYWVSFVGYYLAFAASDAGVSINFLNSLNVTMPLPSQHR